MKSVRHVSACKAYTLIQGDNLVAMRELKKRRRKFVLAYLDPPFMTQRQHWTRGDAVAFDDRWGSLDDYLSELGDRIKAARELLSDCGSLVVHVDPKTSHYVKVACDGIFGRDCFASEIIWRYRRWPSKTQNFQRVHDVLLRYVKCADVAPRWNQLYEPLAPCTVARFGTSKQFAVVGRSGRRNTIKTAEGSPGTPIGDVWDLSIVAGSSKERTGYPTQKPEALLARLMEAVTDPGEAILDPYAGSGTSLVVAKRLKRRVVAIDESPEAVAVILQRLRGLGANLS